MLIPVSLRGPLAGDANVERLQRSLQALAQATNRPAINPGSVSGVVDDPTALAVQAAFGPLTEQLPAEIYLPMQAALMLGATTSTVKGYITQYASQLSVAADAAAVKLKTTTAPRLYHAAVLNIKPTQTPTTTTANPISALFPVGWYKQPWGMALIAIAVFGVWKLFFAAPPKA